MHFGFALELSDKDLWNTDLLDTHLDLFDTDIPSISFVSLMSSRLPQDVLEDVNLWHWRRVEDVFKIDKCFLG